MSGYILRDSEPSIVLTADQVDRLVKNGDGDAALLYLLLMRADRGVTEQELQSRLRWSQLRLNAAEGALQRLGLIQRPAETPAPAPAEERPVYSAQDLAQLLEDDRSFRMLIPQVEEKLGRRLKTADPPACPYRHTAPAAGPPCARSRRRATIGPGRACLTRTAPPVI